MLTFHDASYLKDLVSGVSLHVVRGLVEVAHPGDVVLPALAHVLPSVGDDDSGVPHDII